TVAIISCYYLYMFLVFSFFFFFSSRRRHTRSKRDWSSDVCSSDLQHAHDFIDDPGPVVIDEVMGMLITFFLIPVSWMGMLAGFLLFRVFDVIKPYPAQNLERLPGGLGMMADDAMAAVYANLLLHAAYILAPTFVS